MVKASFHKLYFAYGMNTHLSHMASRCPDAKMVSPAYLSDYGFAFNRHATIFPNESTVTYGVLWRITPECEASLDIYEGYPSYYKKRNVTMLVGEQLVIAMTYIMNDKEGQAPPDSAYFGALAEAYQSHGLPLRQLKQAARHVSFDYSDFLG